MAFQSFEIVTSTTSTRVPLSGELLGWTDEVAHRLNEHAILQRSGSIHQSQGQGPRRFTFRCLLRGASASDDYARTESLLGREPFATLIHPRFGRVPVVFNGMKVSEDLDQRVSGLVVELQLCETGLREVKADTAPAASREASAAASQVVALTAGSAVLAPLAASLVAAAMAYQTTADDITVSQYDLALSLAAVRTAADALAATAGVGVAMATVVLNTRLAYGYCLRSYQLSGAQLPPIVPRRVPARMSLARWCRALYGGGAQAMETEITRLNPIPNLYALTAGAVYLVPDPAAVQLLL